ncbi:MAG: MFS transporter, partial [Chloroflexi bacterium]|nr:MFS transporter [Chloroflexota bacterium]
PYHLLKFQRSHDSGRRTAGSMPPLPADSDPAPQAAAGSDRSSPFPFRAYYFCVFAGVALVGTYLNLYFRRIGMSDVQIGWLSGTMSILGVASPPLWGAISDSMGSKQKPGIALMAATALLCPCFLAARQFGALLLLVAAFGFFSSPIVPLADASVMAHLRHWGGDYGRSRVWGSIGYTVVLAFTGFLLPRTPQGPASALVPVFLAFPAWRVAGIWWARRIREDPPSPTGGRTPIGRAVIESMVLFKRPRMLIFMLCGFLGWGAMQAYYVFFPIYLDALRVSDQHKGLFVALGVVAEIAFLSQVGRVERRIGMYGLFTLGIAAQALRLFFFASRFTAPGSPLGLGEIALAQLLHAFTFAAFYVGCIGVLTRHVPDRLRAGGQTFFSAIVTGLGGFAGAALAGSLAHSYNMGVMFGVSSAIAAAACLLSTVLIVIPDGSTRLG